MYGPSELRCLLRCLFCLCCLCRRPCAWQVLGREHPSATTRMATRSSWNCCRGSRETWLRRAREELREPQRRRQHPRRKRRRQRQRRWQHPRRKRRRKRDRQRQRRSLPRQLRTLLQLRSLQLRALKLRSRSPGRCRSLPCQLRSLQLRALARRPPGRCRSLCSCQG